MPIPRPRRRTRVQVFSVIIIMLWCVTTRAFSAVRILRLRCSSSGLAPTGAATAATQDDDNRIRRTAAMDDNLEQQLEFYNNRKSFNWKSPRQVSRAVFAEDAHCTTRDALLKAALDQNLPYEKRQLAHIIVQLRQQQQSNNKKETLRIGPSLTHTNGAPTTTPALSTAAHTIFVEEDEDYDSIDSLVDSEDPISHTNNNHIHHHHDDYLHYVERLFQTDKNCCVDPYWKDVLLSFTVPSVRNIVQQQLKLDDNCPLGYDPLATPAGRLTTTTKAGNDGTFLHYYRQQKRKHADCILLMRCGDFYETFGIDACCLMEYCHLASMGGKAKAGCPKQNVQNTVDALIAQGLRVAIYEEGRDTDTSPVPSKAGSNSRIKQRFLSQIVSAASPTYLYNLVLSDNNDAWTMGPDPRPYVGILEHANHGYTMTETNMDERSVRVFERLTAEAVACRLAAYPPADPLLYLPVQYTSAKRTLPFLPKTSRLRTVFLNPALVPHTGMSEVERAKSIFVSEFLKYSETHDDDDDKKRMTVKDFTLTSTLVEHAERTRTTTHTRPLMKETATQLGLMENDDKTIPALVPCLLPNSAPVATRRFLKSWLLTPPPSPVADAMRLLVSFFKSDSSPPFAPFSVPPMGKVLTLIRSGQTSAQVFSELMRSLNSAETAIDILQDVPEEVFSAFRTLLEYESGISVNLNVLRDGCRETISIIEQVLAEAHHIDRSENRRSDATTNYQNLVPPDFFVRNEQKWRGHVQPESAPDAYRRVADAARQLAIVVVKDFWNKDVAEECIDSTDFETLLKRESIPFTHDKVNNFIALNKKVFERGHPRDMEYIHPRNRFQKEVRNKYTTKGVAEAIATYRVACEQAAKDVADTLSNLSKRISDEGRMVPVVQAAHANLILSAAYFHAAQANAAGWSLARAEESRGDSAGRFESLWPYWMDREEAVPNTFDLKGMWLFTAPNMSGKSTLMRSTAAAALLSVCGLCAPLKPGSVVTRFDNIFVRGASADVPTERKSAFGAEMGDVASLLRSCGKKSLVFVDELGRGTSPKDGTSLSGAILEALAGSGTFKSLLWSNLSDLLLAGMKGVFATHLHGILDLPLNATGRIFEKRMAMVKCNGDVTWSYRLEDGVCNDSMALLTARKFGMPENVLDRAHALSQLLPHSMSMFDQKPLLDDDPIDAAPRVLAKTFDLVEDALTEVSGQPTIKVLPGWTIPAHMDGNSATYILQLDTAPPRFYVGESDNVRNRLDQHRAKGPHWRNATAILVKAPAGKSQARQWEALMIRKLSREGFNLESKTDGR